MIVGEHLKSVNALIQTVCMNRKKIHAFTKHYDLYVVWRYLFSCQRIP